MGDATIESPSWRLVEVGRIVLIQGDSPYTGRLAAIVEIIDHKRVREARNRQEMGKLRTCVILTGNYYLGSG